MPETLNDKKVFSLLEVAQSIRKTISERYQTSFWVKAEMNKLNHYSYSGHCYPELLEKSDGKVVAQIRTNLWRDDYLRINSNFIRTLNEPLQDGINILFNATVSFDPVHGLSLRIIDIDPVFSLGELEREKLETIETLKKEGIFHQNKSLPVPLLPQRIAVISVETSKGYSDFVNVISGNSWGYKFFCFLFPALLQGDRSIDSIVGQLNRIRKVKNHFDIVVIIRGGGGDVGLSSYNNLRLAREVALFPIPVLTGIGHSTNETVVEMIANRNAITPTELADFLLQMFHNFSVPVQRATESIADHSQAILRDTRTDLTATSKYFRSVTANAVIRNRNDVLSFTRTIAQHATFLIRSEHEYLATLPDALKRSTIRYSESEKNRLSGLEKNVSILDPVNIIRRGFTMTTRNGKAIRSVDDVNEGDSITTITADGSVTSTVTDSKKQRDV